MSQKKFMPFTFKLTASPMQNSTVLLILARLKHILTPFGQIASGYAANLNMNAISFFYSPCILDMNLAVGNQGAVCYEPGMVILFANYCQT